MDNKLFKEAQTASRALLLLSEKEINTILTDLANEAERQFPTILEANAKDLARMAVDNPKYDRLALNEERLTGIINDIKHVAKLPSPLGRVLDDRVLENGLHLVKKSVPFGVIGVIFEARPNVCFDFFSLCFKSVNACI